MFEPHLNERQSRVDWQMIVAVLGLMVIGVSFIYSAKPPTETTAWYNAFYVRQIIWYAMGIGGAIAVCLVDYHSLSRWALIAYWGTILLLIAVLLPHIGAYRLGARRWIDLGFFQLQPSEFAKLSFIFIQAHFLSRPGEELRQPYVFVKAVGLTLLPFLLILKEPDLGSSLVLLPVGLVMTYVAGVPPRFLLRLVGTVGVLVALLLADILFAPSNWQIKLEDYQRRRLWVYFGRDFAADKNTETERQKARLQERNDSWNVRQALISVGSGGFWGKGWRQGQQIALGYLPPVVAHNDFIFSVIAEEKGFLGSVLVLSLYTVVLFTGIRIAGQARDRLGKLLAVGVVTLLFSHVFINIGMNIRLMPVTGIPLPLLSYGGSSVICSLIAAGILQNVHLYRRNY
ncbi:MAG TPA: rod shape-determining protein RodA [Candidatus Angelobacter sp.]|nr:rod shape-determining protein RodA [Candidatus Angelobacter sp.]